MKAATEARELFLSSAARTAGEDVARARYLSTRASLAGSRDAAALEANIRARHATAAARREGLLAERKARAAESYALAIAQQATYAEGGGLTRGDLTEAAMPRGSPRAAANAAAPAGAAGAPVAPALPPARRPVMSAVTSDAGGSDSGRSGLGTLASRRSEASTLTGTAGGSVLVLPPTLPAPASVGTPPSPRALLQPAATGGGEGRSGDHWSASFERDRLDRLARTELEEGDSATGGGASNSRMDVDDGAATGGQSTVSRRATLRHLRWADRAADGGLEGAETSSSRSAVSGVSAYEVRGGPFRLHPSQPLPLDAHEDLLAEEEGEEEGGGSSTAGALPDLEGPGPRGEVHRMGLRGEEVEVGDADPDDDVDLDVPIRGDFGGHRPEEGAFTLASGFQSRLLTRSSVHEDGLVDELEDRLSPGPEDEGEGGVSDGVSDAEVASHLPVAALEGAGGRSSPASATSMTSPPAPASISPPRHRPSPALLARLLAPTLQAAHAHASSPPLPALPPDFLRRKTGVTSPDRNAALSRSQARPAVVPPAPLLRAPPSGEERAAAALAARTDVLRAREAEWSSRLVLANEARRREERTARVSTTLASRRAEAARAEVVGARTRTAAEHDERVVAVRTAVRACRRLQRWFRAWRIRHLGVPLRPVPARPAAAAPRVTASARPAPLRSAASTLRRILHSPIRTPKAADTSPREGEGGEGDDHPSLGAALRGARAAVAALDHPGAHRALSALLSVLTGRPVLDASSEAPAGSPALPSYGAGCPYLAFEACTLALQQRYTVAAAQAVTGLLSKASEALEEGHLRSSRRDSSPSLRPSVARSARTLLAALLIAYFPSEILSTGDMADDSVAAREAMRGRGGMAASPRPRHAPFIASAVTLLAHLHALARAILPPPPANLPAGRAADDGLFGLPSSAFPDLGLDASLHVTPDLRAGLARGATGGGDVDRSARIVHAVSATLASWCAYMDAFVAWKAGDGSRTAQTLAHPFRALLVRRAELTAEAGTAIGVGDAGLEQLREGVEGQLNEIHRQLTALLGPGAALRWERDQQAGLEAEFVREGMRRAASASGSVPTGNDERPAVAGAAPPPPVPLITSPAPTRSSPRPSPSSVSGFSPGFLLGRPPRSPALGASPAPSSAPPPPPRTAPATPPHIPRAAAASPQAGLMRSVLRNEALAHELLIDPSFRLPEPDAPGGLEWEGIGEEDFVLDGSPPPPAPSVTASPGRPSVADAAAGLARRIGAGEAGLSAGTSPSLAAVQAGLDALSSPPPLSLSPASLGPMPSPPLVPPPSARSRLRVRHGGSMRVGPGSDPAALRMSGAFWEAALAAASDADTSGDAAVSLVCAGLESLRESLISLVPHRADMHAEIRGRVEVDLFRSMLMSRSFGQQDWLALLRYIGQLIASLEAPARAEGTAAWLGGAEAFVRRIAGKRAEARAAAGRRGGGESEGGGVTPPLDDDLLILLPRVLAWAHWKIAQVRLDISNANLATLGPYLRDGGRGAEYERGKFEEALAKGEARTDGLRVWLARTLDAETREAEAGAMTGAAGAAAPSPGVRLPPTPAAIAAGTLTRAAFRGDYRIARFVLLRDGLLTLLICPHPLATVAGVAAASPDGIARMADPSAPPAPTAAPASPASPRAPGVLAAAPPPGPPTLSIAYPETFSMDAARLTGAQNTVQKVALVSALSALVQQIVSALPPLPAGYAAAPPPYAPLAVPGAERMLGASVPDLQRCVAAWMADEGLRLPDLAVGILTGADAIARAAGRMPLLESPADLDGPPEGGAAHTSPGQLSPPANSLTAAARSAASGLRGTLRGAVGKVVSASHPLFSTFARRVMEVLRRRLTRELQDTLPTTGEVGKAASFPPWGLFLDAPGTPLPPILASALPAVPSLEAELVALVQMLGRLIRHNHAVFENHYRGLLADL